MWFSALNQLYFLIALIWTYWWLIIQVPLKCDPNWFSYVNSVFKAESNLKTHQRMIDLTIARILRLTQRLNGPYRSDWRSNLLFLKPFQECHQCTQPRNVQNCWGAKTHSLWNQVGRINQRLLMFWIQYLRPTLTMASKDFSIFNLFKVFDAFGCTLKSIQSKTQDLPFKIHLPLALS